MYYSHIEANDIMLHFFETQNNVELINLDHKFDKTKCYNQ